MEVLKRIRRIKRYVSPETWSWRSVKMMLPSLGHQCCLWPLCCWRECKGIHPCYLHCQWSWCSDPAKAAGEPRRIQSLAAVAATSGDACNVEEHGTHTYTQNTYPHLSSRLSTGETWPIASWQRAQGNVTCWLFVPCNAEWSRTGVESQQTDSWHCYPKRFRIPDTSHAVSLMDTWSSVWMYTRIIGRAFFLLASVLSVDVPSCRVLSLLLLT